MNKNYYYQKQLATIDEIKSLTKKPSLLMHVCCGPCSCFPLSFLCDYFDLTLYFNNSNIYPFDEYQRRLDELVDYLDKAKLDVKLIVNPYDENYTSRISIFKDEPEGKRRCLMCYGIRMDQAYRFADENGYDYFCTVMTISRQKNSQILNQIGEKLAHKYPNTKYFYSDFKKNNGNLIGIQIADSFDLYKQDYCGCVYSYEKRQSHRMLKEDLNSNKDQ